MSVRPRIVSMDQYRGYAVIGMFVVNFLGGLSVTHQFLKHNNTHFSWADSIMPAFIFACGFSFRLSVLKRLPQIGHWKTRAGILRRSMALVLISLVMYGSGNELKTWSELTTGSGIGEFVAHSVKADLWEVLAIIGVCQILVLPFIELSSKARLLVAIAFSAGHIAISAWFNYAFVTGQPNGLDDLWGTGGRRAWDGGLFGLISWSVPMLAGTLVYDLMSSQTPRKTVIRLLTSGFGLMALGYLISCLTTLYDVRENNTVDVARTAGEKYAVSPVFPPWQNIKGRNWHTLLAEPPFVPPPSTAERKVNYWAMDKRVSTQSFIWFATGFSCVTYALFILACDLGGLQSRLFAMFGENALAAYIIHHSVQELVRQIVPKDSPSWYAACGLLLFSSITWFFVRHLQKANIFLKL